MKKYTISNTKCRECGGHISWDDYPFTQYPIHVDSKGNKIETGSCLKYGSPPIQHEISKKPAARPKKSFKNYLHNIKKTVMKSPNNIITIAVVTMLASSIPIGLFIAGINQNTNSSYDDNNDYNPPDPPPSPQWEIDAQGT